MANSILTKAEVEEAVTMATSLERHIFRLKNLTPEQIAHVGAAFPKYIEVLDNASDLQLAVFGLIGGELCTMKGLLNLALWPERYKKDRAKVVASIKQLDAEYKDSGFEKYYIRIN